jgi:DNA polymerase
MRKVTIDFETRSAVDLTTAGAWRYAEDSTTSVLCLAVKVDDETPMIWFPPEIKGNLSDNMNAPGVLVLAIEVGLRLLGKLKLAELVEKADVIEAHNMGFERAMWRHHMVRRGFDDLPLGKLRDSAAKAAMHALPRKLEKAAEAVGLSVKKDMEGYKLMLKMCKPRPLRKAELQEIAERVGDATLKEVKRAYARIKDLQFNAPKIDGVDPNRDFLRWHETPEQIIRLAEYCVQDVETERALSEALDDLSPQEQKIWELDQIINERGIPADSEMVEAAVKKLREAETKQLQQMIDLIRYESNYGWSEENFQPITFQEAGFEKLTSPRQTELFRQWINSQISEPKLLNIQAATIKKTLKRNDLPKVVREVLTIRRSLSKSSSAKYQTVKDKLCRDGTMKDCFMYHGARTGRWAGRGFQPQNLPRAGLSPDASSILIDIIKSSPSLENLEMLTKEPFFQTASKLIRSLVKAPEDWDLICADYKSVEARGLAWLANEVWKLSAFHENQPVYEMAAAKIYGKHAEDITPEERQTGKMLELACGYGGGYRAVLSMCHQYNVSKLRLKAGDVKVPELEDKKGIALFKEPVDSLVKGWRSSNPKIVKFWKDLEYCFFDAINNPGIQLDTPIGYGMHDYTLRFYKSKSANSLAVTLPSGRKLYYYNPHIRTLPTPWGTLSPTFCYWGVSSQKEKVVEGKPAWGCLSTHGGKIAENITQAMCRDLLAEGMLKLEETGVYKPILHAHDEAAALVRKDQGSLAEFCEILSAIPAWANGFPLGAEGWRGERYRK